MAEHHIIPPEWQIGSDAILANLVDGVYITDTERRILYWSDAAERITGWSRAEVVGKCCRDNILNHVDKDGRPLCGKEHCPLQRTIVTGTPTRVPIIVYARTRDGRRIPMHVSTAPLRDREGTVVGAIEVFRDMSHVLDDLQRAKTIQGSAMALRVLPDDRTRLRTLYSPCDIVGGDFYSVEDIDAHRTIYFLADVMGHGIAAALYSMFFRMLWAENTHLLGEPAAFLNLLDRRIHPLLSENYYFATAVALVLDKSTGQLRCAGAGHPSPLVFRAHGIVDSIDCTAMPLGLCGDAGYGETVLQLHPDDSVLLYTDGAIELETTEGTELGEAGLIRIVRETLEPNQRLPLRQLEENLLKASRHIRPPDDVTLLWLAYLDRHSNAAHESLEDAAD